MSGQKRAAKVTSGDKATTAVVTPDGRYFVVRGRLWRTTNPDLSQEERSMLVKQLMEARRKKGIAMRAGDEEARERERGAVDAAKKRLGERGEVWWSDGSPDYNRYLAKNTPYAAWYEKIVRSQQP